MALRLNIPVLFSCVFCVISLPAFAQETAAPAPAASSFLAPEAGNSPTAPVEIGFDDAMATFNSGDYKLAQQQFWGLATKGDMRAQFYMGYLLDSGIGKTGRDPILAFNWFKKSAEQGYVPAMVQMGFAMSTGRGASKNEAEALEWYAKAAQLGDATAQNNLGSMLRSGRPYKKDPKLAAQWFKLSAEQGNARAQYNLASMLRTGEGIPKDEDAAFKWYSLAAQQNDVFAQNALGDMYRAGAGVDQSHNEAMKWYGKAAQAGHLPAQLSLARLYEMQHAQNGRGAEIAVKWYQLAVKQDSAEAMLRLGQMYENGTGVAQNLDEALRLYKIAADEQLYIPAMMALAAFYETAPAPKQNLARASQLFENVANTGYGPAMLEAGRIYRDAVGVPKNPISAYKWFALAAENIEDRDLKADAVIARINASKTLSQTDISAANNQIRQWKPSLLQKKSGGGSR